MPLIVLVKLTERKEEKSAILSILIFRYSLAYLALTDNAHQYPEESIKTGIFFVMNL